jgi:Aminoglycoside-2''-adenylyltransferase
MVLQKDGTGQGMDLVEVLEILADLAEAGCSVWVAGGWGVDALVGRQTRSHRDLDLALDARNQTTALRTLERRGYRVETDWRPVRVELVNEGRGGSMYTRWFSTQPVMAVRPTSAAVISTIRQRRSIMAYLAVCTCRACPVISNCSSIPATNLARSTCLILRCLST